MQKKIKKVKAAKKKMRGGGMVKAAKKKMQSGGAVVSSEKMLKKAESRISKGKPELTAQQRAQLIYRNYEKGRAETRRLEKQILEDFDKKVAAYNKVRAERLAEVDEIRARQAERLGLPGVAKAVRMLSKKTPTKSTNFYGDASPEELKKAAKKKMRGGGMVKAAKKKMRGGGMVKAAKKKR